MDTTEPEATSQAAQRTRLLTVAGMTPGRWLPLALALADGMRAIRADWQVDVSGPPLPAPPASDRCIAFFERADAALVAGRDDPGSSLQSWQRCAEQLLHSVQAAPGRIILIDTDEALEFPEGLAGVVLRCTGESITPVWPTRSPDAEPGLSWLAARWCDGHRRVRSLENELLGCTTPLSAGSSEHVRAECAGDAEAAFQRHASLLSTEAAYKDTEKSLAATANELRDAHTAVRNLRCQLLESHAEHELLLAQMQAVQEEFTSLLKAKGATPAWLPTVSVVLEHRNEDPPHRELRFRFNDVSLGDRMVRSVRVKLVEHIGRAGLVLMADDDESRVLSQWHTDGQEEDLQFMLLVPMDTSGRDKLLRLGTTDWEAVLQLAGMLQESVAAQESLGPHWLAIAARLKLDLDALPARLRYDCLEVTRQPHGDATRIVLGGVRFGTQRLADVVLHWQRGRIGEELVWELPAGVGVVPPISAWPVEVSGAPALRWSLAVGSGFGFRARVQWWLTLAPGERALMLSLLDVLPAAGASLRKQAHRACVWRHVLAALRMRLR
jgi:hypothetical protein